MSLAEIMTTEPTSRTPQEQDLRSANRGLDLLILLGVSSVFATIPFQWTKDVPIGPIGLNPFHLAVAFCMMVYLLDFRHFAALGDILRKAILTHIAVFSYLFAIGVTFFWSPYPEASLLVTIKYALIYLVALGVGSMIRVRPREFSIFLAYVAIPLSAFMFFVYACLVFRAEGKSFPTELLNAVKSKNLVIITHQVVNPLLVEEEDESSDRGPKSAVVVKNTFAGSIFVLFCGAKLGSSARPRQLLFHGLKPLRLLTMLGMVAAIGLLGSRSGLLIVFLSLSVEALVTASQGMKGVLKILALLTVTIGILISFLFLDSGSDFLEGIQEIGIGRFDEVGDDSRWRNYHDAMQAIQRDFPFGRGAGVSLPNGLKVHNNFLGGAFEAGLLGFLTITAVYFLFWKDIISSFLKRVQLHVPLTSWELWAFLAVLLPMFHCLLAGDAGRFNYAEWICFALFWGFHGNRDYEQDPSLNPVITSD
ncbi:MAG: O-antigen ligase family protein [Planctomycetaceae bacterium]|nr:O-antigen ligase family protein [Planctomycetaceae bacterium]